MTTKDFFNKLAFERNGYCASSTSLAYHFQKTMRNKTLRWINEPKIILDVACGRGEFTEMLARRFPKSFVIGIDFAEKMIELAKKSYCLPNLTFNQGNLLNLPFPDKFFNVTACLGTIYHIPNLEKAITELCRITKDTIIIEFKNNKSICWRFYEFLWYKSNPEIKLYGTDYKRITDIFKKYGFLIKKAYSIFRWKVLSPNMLVMVENK